MRYGRRSGLIVIDKRSRTIGTTESSIQNAEAELGFSFPTSFRNWLLVNNGRGIEDVTIFPVSTNATGAKPGILSSEIIETIGGNGRKILMPTFQNSFGLPKTAAATISVLITLA